MQGIPGTVTSFVHLGSDDEGKTGNYKRRSGSSRALQQEYSKPLVVEYQTSTMPRQATFSSKTIADSRPSQSLQAWPVIIQYSTKSILNQHKLENIGPVQRFVHLGKPANRKQKVFERSIVNFQTGRQRLKVRKRVTRLIKLIPWIEKRLLNMDWRYNWLFNTFIFYFKTEKIQDSLMQRKNLWVESYHILFKVNKTIWHGCGIRGRVFTHLHPQNSNLLLFASLIPPHLVFSI